MAEAEAHCLLLSCDTQWKVNPFITPCDRKYILKTLLAGWAGILHFDHGTHQTYDKFSWFLHIQNLFMSKMKMEVRTWKKKIFHIICIYTYI